MSKSSTRLRWLEPALCLFSLVCLLIRALLKPRRPTTLPQQQRQLSLPSRAPRRRHNIELTGVKVPDGNLCSIPNCKNHAGTVVKIDGIQINHMVCMWHLKLNLESGEWVAQKPLAIARKCLTCPFNDGYNEEATIAQNYGCLPTKFDILDAKDKRNEDWLCHSDETKICGGLAAERRVGNGKPILYSEWYHQPK